jgi:hypothetical protein
VNEEGVAFDVTVWAARNVTKVERKSLQEARFSHWGMRNNKKSLQQVLQEYSSDLMICCEQQQ